MLEVILKLLLILTLILQGIVLINILISNHERNKHDREFWEELMKQLQKDTERFLDEDSKEEVNNGTRRKNKKCCI